jgi:hypothetical protein
MVVTVVISDLIISNKTIIGELRLFRMLETQWMSLNWCYELHGKFKKSSKL